MSLTSLKLVRISATSAKFEFIIACNRPYFSSLDNRGNTSWISPDLFGVTFLLQPTSDLKFLDIL